MDLSVGFGFGVFYLLLGFDCLWFVWGFYLLLDSDCDFGLFLGHGVVCSLFVLWGLCI